MLRRIVGLATLVGILVAGTAHAAVKLTTIGNFSAPTYITAPPGDTHRVFVVQQQGVIKLIKDGGSPTTFLDISSRVRYAGGEQGLLSLAFAPDYATTHRFFVYYTSTNCPQSPGCDERVSAFTADSGGDTASASSEQVLITIPHPFQANHNGGQLQFGPDGDLYISVGDGGGGNDTGLNAQFTNRLLGKILRIAPGVTSYSIPAGNPFSGGALCSSGANGGATCPEIWAYGLRNPWRFSFDMAADRTLGSKSATGAIVIGDVGQGRDEEIDFAYLGQNAGANYGWPCYEGFELNASAPPQECSPRPSRVVDPVLAYPHPVNCSGAPYCGAGIIGGYVMHDPTLPSLNGCYVFGDLGNSRLRVARLDQPLAVGATDLGVQVANLSSFGQDASGHIYAADIGTGIVYRLDSDGNAATVPTCPAASTTATTGTATNVTFATARLTGTVASSRTDTAYRFDYGPTTSYGSTVGPATVGASSAAVPVSSDVSGLAPSTVYHFRIVALHGGIPVAFGADAKFTTQAAPVQMKHPPVNRALPVIVGLPTPGGVLTCRPGSWSAVSSLSYRWLRDGAAISPGATYRPTAPDLGHFLSCRVTATNADGASSATSAPVHVRDLLPPKLTLLRLAPTAFTAARSGRSIARKGRAGTAVTFRLNEPAILTVTVERARPGRRISGRCQRVTNSNRRAAQCTIWSAVNGSFSSAGRTGSNAFRFTGRIGARGLAPGRYRLVIGARDHAGNLARPVRASFSILGRR